MNQRNADRGNIEKFVDHLLAYVMGSEAHLPKSVLQQSGFTVSIGKAVQLYMSQLPQTEHSDFNWILVLIGNPTTTCRYVNNLSTYLSRSVTHYWFFFFAVLCELCIVCVVLEDEYLQQLIKDTAVRGISMFMPWIENQICVQLDTSAEDLLTKGNVNLRLETL